MLYLYWKCFIVYKQTKIKIGNTSNIVWNGKNVSPNKNRFFLNNGVIDSILFPDKLDNIILLRYNKIQQNHAINQMKTKIKLWKLKESFFNIICDPEMMIFAQIGRHINTQKSFKWPYTAKIRISKVLWWEKN